jgi:LPXTG-site transpeptidase (sortase) family protein
VPSKRALLLPALGAFLLVSGCGGGGGSGSHGTQSRPAAASGTRSGPPAVAANAAADPVARSVPVSVRIPSIGVDAPIIQLGLNADDTVQVPPIRAHDPAGWYRSSPTPGQVGPSVILGHVTVGQYGDGVFVHLKQLKRGDHVDVRLKDGVTSVFTVDSTRTVKKASFPTDAVYGDTDRPELRLITCGGSRNAQGGGYSGNVIVYASLTSSSQ